jgi:hypothetical protein
MTTKIHDVFLELATATTQGAGDNSQNVATTAFVQALLASSASANGYVKIGSIILQWGTGPLTGPGTRNVPILFPVNFPNACFVVIPVAQWQSGQNSSLVEVEEGSITQSGFNFGVANAGSVNGSTTPMWIAIGN